MLINALIKLRFYLFTTVLILFTSSIHAENTLVFNVTGQPPLNTPAHDGFMDEVTREALKRIGYKLVINRQPAERGLRSINSGKIDGEMSRIRGIEKIYPNLVMVDEKIMNWDFVVFSEKDIQLANGWNSLEKKNLAFINGWKILEKNVPASAVITKVKNSSQLFTLLKKGRVDYVIYEHWGGHKEIDLLKLKNIRLRKPELASKEMFIYLHKKHASLAPKIAAALKGMKQDGSYQKLEKKYLKDNYAQH